MKKIELRDLVISAIVLAFMFSYQGYDKLESTLWLLPVGLFTISISFLAHEMAHRYYAKKYGCHAEYQIWWYGVLVGLLFAVASNGWVKFAALGAVMIFPAIDMWGNMKVLTRKEYGLISLAGPVVNLALAGVFFLVGIFVSPIFFLGFTINVWLAIFNMLPIWILDGAKIFTWNKFIWGFVFAVSIVLFILSLVYLPI